MFRNSVQRELVAAMVGIAVILTATGPAVGQPTALPPRPDGPAQQRMAKDVSQMALDRFFDKLDPNRTGKISRASYLDDAKTMFDRIDMNHDGKLERSEVKLDALEHRRSMAGAMGAREMMSMPTERPMLMPMGMNMCKPHELQRGPFADIPRDANGDISRDAYMKAADARFDAIDTGHTGTITVPMYRAYLQMHRPAEPASQPMHSTPPAGH